MATESNKSSMLTKFLVFLALLGVGMVYGNLIAPTSEQKKFLAESGYAKPRAWLKALCREKSDCQQYADARQKCAAAGNIDQCVSIKMNGSVPGLCSDNGHIVITRLFAGSIDLTEQNIVPGALQCLALRFVKEEQ